MSHSEFEIIKKFFQKNITQTKEIKHGVGDDAAIVAVPENMELALSMDTFISGIHFPENTRPEDVGYKSLAINISDMAAMGAVPHWAMLSLTIPDADREWLEKFSRGFFEMADKSGVKLIGGDLNRGPLSITVQIHGLLPAGSAITRGGARIDDLVYVSGQLGDAGLALAIYNHSLSIPELHHASVIERLNRPEPRTALGIKLREMATSAIDISDGLISDLGHILDKSRCGAIINPEHLPLSDAFGNLPGEKSWNIAITAGDDYELCFTIPPDKQSILENNPELEVPVHCIGKIVDGSGIQWIKSDGLHFEPTGPGFQHF